MAVRTMVSCDFINWDATWKRRAFSASRRASRSRLTLLPSFFTGSSFTTMARGAPLAALRNSDRGRHVEAESVFGQQTGFAVEADVVAIVLHGKLVHHHGAGRSAGGVAEFRLKIDILGEIARRIGIGDVRGHEFLPGAQQVHIP